MEAKSRMCVCVCVVFHLHARVTNVCVVIGGTFFI